MARRKRERHGETNTRLYTIWCNMQQRCCNPNHERYDRYGGRGITVCEDWRGSYIEFRKWAHANGYAEDLTIDRIDNDGDYEPSNCRWATYAEQGRNTSDNRHITAFGETKLLCDWPGDTRAAEYLTPQTLRERIDLLGWRPERAITQLVRASLHKSEYRGVSWHNVTRKWRARIILGGKDHHLGLFDSEIEAARAYNIAALKLHGEFALLNDLPAPTPRRSHLLEALEEFDLLLAA